MAKRIDPILLLLSLFLIWRVAFLHTHNHLSPDGAVIGLMARHILEGEFPVFFYGYGYIGSLKSFIAAGLFLLFGATTKTLLLLPALFYIGFVWTTYWLALLLANRVAARVAMLLTLLCSHWLTFFSAEIVGGYMDTLLYGNLLLIFFTKFCLAENSVKPKWTLVLGLIAGLSFWQFPLSGYYLVTLGFSLFILRPKNIFSKILPLFACSFFVGSFPFWVYNWTHHFISFSMVSSADLNQFVSHLVSYFQIFIPRFLGWWFQADSLIDQMAWSILIGLFVLSFFYLANLIRWRWRDPKAPILFLALFSILLFARSNYVGERSPMTVLPLLLLFPMLMGFLFEAINKNTKILFWLLLPLVIYPYGKETYASISGRQQNSSHYTYVQNQFIEALKSKNINRLFAPYIRGPVISFRTQEKIITSHPLEEAIPGYQDKVAAAIQPSFLFSDKESQPFEENLASLGCSYQKEEILNYLLFYDIIRVRPLGNELSPVGWKGPKEAFDRDIVTRWSTHLVQEPGQVFEIKLDKVRLLSGCELRTLNFYDLPRRLKIEISENGSAWKEVFSIPLHKTPLYWSGTHPFIDLEFGRVEFSFTPTKGRFIRFTQMGKSKSNYWSINELFLFEEGKIKIPQEKVTSKTESILEETEKLIPLLIEMNGGPLYTDTWLSAKLSEKNIEQTLKFLPLYNPRLNLSRLVPSNPQVTRFIDWEKNPVFVIDQNHENDFERSSFYQQNHWSKFPNGDWTLYTYQSSNKSTLTEIPRESWKAEASPHGERSGRAFRQKPGKAWKTFEAQKKGMFYLLDLGKAKEIQEIHLDSGKYRLEYPRYFEVLLSNDKQNWEKPKNVQLGVAYWDGKRILKSTLKDNVLPIKIERTKARYIKIALTEDFTYSQWRLEDIRVYQ